MTRVYQYCYSWAAILLHFFILVNLAFIFYPVVPKFSLFLFSRVVMLIMGDINHKIIYFSEILDTQENCFLRMMSEK